MADNFVNVSIKVGNQTQNIKMEKGMMFENNGGTYCLFDDGTLKFMPKGSNVWENAEKINMTNYQWKAFQNISNNDGDKGTYSQKDILKAQELYKQGNFTADMSKDLPYGYKIERPSISTPKKSVEVFVGNGDETQSATLKFKVADINALKEASAAYQAEHTQQTGKTQSSAKPTSTQQTGKTSATAQTSTQNTVDKATMEMLSGLDDNGKPTGKFDAENFSYIFYDKDADFSSKLYPDSHLSSDEQKRVENILKQFDGKEITPELVNELVNTLANDKTLSNNGEAMSDLLKLHKSLSPITINNLFRQAKSINITVLDPKEAKQVYNKMQATLGTQMYYTKILNTDAFTGKTIGCDDTWCRPEILENYIFEKPMSDETFNKLNHSLRNLNNVRKARYSAAPRDMLPGIKALKDNGQITEHQYNALCQTIKDNPYKS